MPGPLRLGAPQFGGRLAISSNGAAGVMAMGQAARSGVANLIATLRAAARETVRAPVS